MFKQLCAVILGLTTVTASALSFTLAPAYAQTQDDNRMRRVSQTHAPEAAITLNEQFFNSLLDAIFTNLRGPSFPLSLTRVEAKRDSLSIAASAQATTEQRACESVIVLEREISGVKTAIRFENRRIAAPLAFTGSYNVAVLGCVRFQGWADTNLDLEFDRERQVLSGRVRIVGIHLNDISPRVSSMVAKLAQNSIDKRLNPIQLLQSAQLSARLPITAAGGALLMRAKEVRPEIVPGALRIHILYEFMRAQ